jgi:hypothetical protein
MKGSAMWPVAIVGQLKPRSEDPDALAARLSICFARLSELDPLFSGWVRGGMRHRSAVPRVVTLPPNIAELRTWMAENSIFSSRDGYKHLIGYSIRARTPASNSFRTDFWLSCLPSDHWLGNRIGVTVSDGQVQSQPTATAISPNALRDIFREALTIVGTAWECEWAAVMPGDFRSKGEHASEISIKYHSGWMIYLDQSLAHDVGSLDKIDVSELPNKAMLITSVPDERFNPYNPIHRTAAERVQTALRSLNGK